MNAKEAHKVALKFNTMGAEGQYKKIQDLIEQEASKGNYHCFFYESLNQDVKNKLQLEGFTIGADQGRYNEICIRINW